MSTEFLTMAVICLVIRLSSSPLHRSSSSCLNTFGFSGVLLLCLELLFYTTQHTQASVTNGANTLSYNWTAIPASVSYRVCEASVRTEAITAVI